MSEPTPTPEPETLPSRLARRLGLAPGDAAVLDALRRATSRFEGEIGYAVNLVEDDTVVLCGDGSRSLLLPARPVVGDPVVSCDGVTVPAAEYGVRRHSGILRHHHGWPDGDDNLAVTYSHGWAVMPEDIAAAILEMAEGLHWSTPGVIAVEAGSERRSFSVTALQGVTQQWADAVGRYRIGNGA